MPIWTVLGQDGGLQGSPRDPGHEKSMGKKLVTVPGPVSAVLGGRSSKNASKNFGGETKNFPVPGPAGKSTEKSSPGLSARARPQKNMGKKLVPAPGPARASSPCFSVAGRGRRAPEMIFQSISRPVPEPGNFWFPPQNSWTRFWSFYPPKRPKLAPGPSPASFPCFFRARGLAESPGDPHLGQGPSRSALHDFCAFWHPKF